MDNIEKLLRWSLILFFKSLVLMFSYSCLHFPTTILFLKPIVISVWGIVLLMSDIFQSPFQLKRRAIVLKLMPYLFKARKQPVPMKWLHSTCWGRLKLVPWHLPLAAIFAHVVLLQALRSDCWSRSWGSAPAMCRVSITFILVLWTLEKVS